MVSLDTIQSTTTTTINKSPIINDQISSPRISFSSEFLDDSRDFISICPKSPLREISTSTNPNHTTTNHPHNHNHHHRRPKARNVTDPHFEFRSGHNSLSNGQKMITADELFFEGKLLPFWQAQSSEKLNNLKVNDGQEIDPTDGHHHHEDQVVVISKEISVDDGNSNINIITTDPNNNPSTNPNRVSSTTNNNNSTWFVDDDPSPRPPKCTVLWKELLRLKKQRATSTLSPSSSSSSSSSSNSSMADIIIDHEKNSITTSTRHSNSSNSNKDHHHHHHHKSNSNSNSNNKGVRKGLERTRSATIRIRPMINVPICSQVKSTSASSSSSLPPLFPLKKGKLFDR